MPRRPPPSPEHRNLNRQLERSKEHELKKQLEQEKQELGAA